MTHKELLNYRVKGGSALVVVPKKNMKDSKGNTVYKQKEPVVVRIDKFLHEEKTQIYRFEGHWVKGNSHKCYPSLDHLLVDFDIMTKEEIDKSNILF